MWLQRAVCQTCARRASSRPGLLTGQRVLYRQATKASDSGERTANRAAKEGEAVSGVVATEFKVEGLFPMLFAEKNTASWLFLVVREILRYQNPQ